MTTTAGDRVADVAADILADGPMGDTLRGDDYAQFLERTWGRGGQLRRVHTSCAVFAGACLIEAGVLGSRHWCADGSWGITTWVGAHFGSPSWLSVDDEEPERGDIFYICGDANPTWKAATNGHVGILVDGSGPQWRTAEGGGSPGGTICRLSEGHKNIYQLSRTLRGFWRPALMAEVRTPYLPVSYGMRGPRVGELQLRLVKLGYTELGAVDSMFGSKTMAALQRFQAEHALFASGLCDRETWERIQRSTEPSGIAVTNGDGQ